MVSYEIAMGMSVVSAVLMTSFNKDGTGTLSMIGIVRSQQDQGIWFLFKFFPLGLVAFVTFVIAMIAETNRAPFDMAEAESELTAGYHTEYSGLRWSLFMLSEYAAMIAVSSIAVTLWLGGWLRPFPNLLHAPAWDFIFSLFPGLTFLGLAAIAFIGVARMPAHFSFKIQRIGLAVFAALLGCMALLLLLLAVAGRSADSSIAARFREGIDYVYWFILKVALFMYLFIWLRATWPRYRFDQLMRIGWKVLLPITLGVLVLTAIVGVLAS
jgi:NADH-quinone oxidoreductase subunit H